MRKKLRYPPDLAPGELHAIPENCRPARIRRRTRQAKRRRARFSRRVLRRLDDLETIASERDHRQDKSRRRRPRPVGHVFFQTGENSWDVVYL